MEDLKLALTQGKNTGLAYPVITLAISRKAAGLGPFRSTYTIVLVGELSHHPLQSLGGKSKPLLGQSKSICRSLINIRLSSWSRYDPRRVNINSDQS